MSIWLVQSTVIIGVVFKFSVDSARLVGLQLLKNGVIRMLNGIEKWY